MVTSTLENDHPLVTNRSQLRELRVEVEELRDEGGGRIRSNRRIEIKGYGITEHESVINSRKVMRFLA